MFRSVSDSGLPPNISGTVVTVGTFDGVHLGHLDVINRLSAKSRELGLANVVLTFDPHPLEVVNPSAAPALLTPGDEKIEVIAETGIDYLAILPFTATLSEYSAEEFVELVLRRRFRMRHLLIGHDHGFGRQRAGNVDVLRDLGKRLGFGVDVVEAVTAGGRAISSTAIRRAIAGGDLTTAAAGLGRAYSLSGYVARGAGRGRTLGFPTINVTPLGKHKLLPPEGIYAIRAHTVKGSFGGAMHMGPRPVFRDPTVTLEAFLFDTDGDFYESRVRIDFIQRLREVRNFSGPDELVEQMHRDVEKAREILR